ncbi:MAG: histidine kinase dimerization/phospho-acceptor domain-containing protein [Kofleriaceae bacterium]
MGVGLAASSDVSRIAHDLRTPLNTLLGFAQLLQRDRDRPLSGRQSEWIELVIESGMRLLRITDELVKLPARGVLDDTRLTCAVESIEHAFALFDSDDRIVTCNAAFRALLRLQGDGHGIAFADILDSVLADIPFGTEHERAEFRTARLAGRKTAASKTIDVIVRGQNLRIVDRRMEDGSIVTTIIDRTEDERTARELSDARAAAEAASAAKSEFLSSMSHELRTPMNAILGFAQLLDRDRKEPLSLRHRERVSQILRGGGHLLHLIDDVLDLSRIEAGKIAISPEPVDVRDVLDDARRTLEPLAMRTGIALVLDDVVSTVPMALADRTRFAQIVMNFGSNAIKYNRPEGHVRFIVSNTATHVRVTVEDNGLGIDDEAQAKLFQPFQRAGQEGGPIEGTGIGLVITKRLAELMDGRVGFESERGHGSRFWVELPIATTSAPERTSRSRLLLEANPQRRLVVYIEDNRANISFMRDFLDSIGNYELLTASTALRGIAIVREQQPDVVLMDMNLPDMTGREALEVLRSTSEAVHIPIIAVTAAASKRERQLGIQAGFFRYLTKPVDLDELALALREAHGNA